MTVSSRSLIMLADALRQRRTELGTKWRRLPVGIGRPGPGGLIKWLSTSEGG
jgi:hypothetical protein